MAAEIIVKQTIDLTAEHIEDAVKSYVASMGYEVIGIDWAKPDGGGSYAVTVNGAGAVVHVKPIVAKPAAKKQRQARKPRASKPATPPAPIASEPQQKPSKAAS